MHQNKTLLIGFVFSAQILFCQTSKIDLKTYKNKQVGLEFKYPASWEEGASKISNTYWVTIPNFKSSGNVVLKVNPWVSKPDFKNYTSEQYKRDILSTSNYYKDLVFIDFTNDLVISEVNAIYAYFKGIGVLKDKYYYEILIQWWSGNLLYTLQGQFSEPELTKDNVALFKEIIKTIKLNP